MRDLILARADEMLNGGNAKKLRAIPSVSQMQYMRRPKDMAERLTRQQVWIQAQVDDGRLPVGFDLASIDDATLLMLFERIVRMDARP